MLQRRGPSIAEMEQICWIPVRRGSTWAQRCSILESWIEANRDQACRRKAGNACDPAKLLDSPGWAVGVGE